MSFKKNTLHFIVLILLLMAVFIQPFLSSRHFSPAFDELTHLPSGYVYLKTGDFSLNPQHPPLVKLLAALPLLFVDVKFPVHFLEMGEWKFGSKFIFENDADKILLLGRLAPILISTLLAVFVYKWARELFGKVGGLTALFFYAFMPNILAHSQFVATDMGVTSFGFISCYWLWKHYQSNKFKHLVFSGLFLGLALGSKFSALLLVPILAVLIVLKEFFGAGLSLVGCKNFAKKFFIIGAVSSLVVWAIYFFPSDPLFYLKGYKTVYADKNPNFQFYLNGNYSTQVWWYYFLFAFLVKTPIVFTLSVIAVFVFWKKLGLKMVDAVFLIIPIFLFFTVTSLKAYNISVRYILPVYPFLVMCVAGLPNVIKNIKLNRTLAGTTLFVVFGWQLISTVKVYPHYLSYFNEFSGGPENGFRRLDDSNLDWGQSLKMLADYQKKDPELKVVYHWSNMDTGYYGINNDLISLRKSWWSNPVGRYAVDINFLIRLRILSRLRNDPKLDWLTLYKPIDRIGYSYLVYEFK